MRDTALLLVDLQNDYFEGGANPLENSQDAVIKAKQILEFFRKKGLPVFHIQHISTAATAAFFLPGTKGVEIHEQVAPLVSESLIVKHFPNSFRETTLLTELRAMNITNLVICGMMTHMCIDATVRAAKDAGFTITLIYDACATKDLTFNNKTVMASDVHNAYLAALNGLYARVLSAEKFFQ